MSETHAGVEGDAKWSRQSGQAEAKSFQVPELANPRAATRSGESKGLLAEQKRSAK